MGKKILDKKSLEEIKKSFEHKSYYVRSEFMATYFVEDYRNYFVDFIVLNTFSIKCNDYLSDLVDYTTDFKIFDPVITATWYRLLRESTSALVLLVTLDYFYYCSESDLPVNYADTLINPSKKHKIKIIKN